MRVFRDLNHLPSFNRAVVTIGSFDGVHRGHQFVLARVNELARERGGESVVITFDPHPRRVLQPDFKGLQLVTTTDEKIERLQEYGVQNVVVVPFTREWSQQTPEAYIEDFLVGNFQPAAVVIGYDHRFGRDRAGDVEMLRAYGERLGFEVAQIERQMLEAITVSSTQLRDALRAGDVERAHRLMGHPFQLTGEVVHGQRIGTQIGFPTANLDVAHPDKLIPPDGIYAVRARTGDWTGNGMLYIGKRPTLAGELARTIETHLFDFQRDIYGETLQLELLHYVRGDEKFDSLDALTAQLRHDEMAVKSLISAPSTSSAWSTRAPIAVATVILNYNGRHWLERYLPDLLKTTYASHRIIVADNGSTDDSVEFLRQQYPQVERIELPENHGFAEGYNRALAQIDVPLVCLLNSDVRVTPDWLEPLVAHLEQHPDCIAVQPKIRDTHRPERFEYAGAAGGFLDRWYVPFCRGRILDTVETDDGQYESPTSVDWTSGAAMLVRTEAFRQLGGFDGSYFAHWEEIDWCWRARRAGWSLACVPASVVYHAGGGTLAYQSPRKVYLNHRNHLITLLKNLPARSRWWLVPWVMVLHGLNGLLLLLRGQFRGFGAILRAHAWMYAHLGTIRRRRRRDRTRIERHRRGTATDRQFPKWNVLVGVYLRGRRRFSQFFQP